MGRLGSQDHENHIRSACFMTSVYGAVTLVPGKIRFMPYDFNQRTIQRDLHCTVDDGSLAENIFTEPIVINNGELFESRVTTNLPCRMTKIPFEGISRGRVACLCGDTVVFPNPVGSRALQYILRTHAGYR